jgi:xanthine dehydrogenase accessory factor
MREIIPSVDNWLAKHEKIALATVIQTWGSSPRGVGAKMAFTPGNKITGSVSGGCVEGAVFEAGVEVLKTGNAKWLHFGVADETAWQVGLACGGQLDVFVDALDEDIYALLRDELLAGRPVAIATLIQGPAKMMGNEILMGKDRLVHGGIASELDRAIIHKMKEAFEAKRSQIVSLERPGKEAVEVFIEVIDPQPVLVMVGGVHTSVALTSIAKTLGFRTIVVDPRRAFGNAERFPHVDQLIKAWPDEALAQVPLTEYTAVALLTHDPKIDDPALKIVLNSPVFYIGALGSPTTQAKRRQRLAEAGFNEEQMARIHGPIGLQMGAKRPEELALAIMAEIVATQHGVMVGAVI